MLDIVEEEKPKSILEVGTYKGYRAIDMSARAIQYNSVHYYGYDLFEDITPKMQVAEFSHDDWGIESEVRKELSQFRLDCLLNNKNTFNYTLIRGNTRETLVNCDPVDFVWLDGGHAIETIISDYNNVKESKCIVFDDYWEYISNFSPDDIVGCNSLIDQLDAEIIMTADPLYNWRGDVAEKIGTIGIAIIRK